MDSSKELSPLIGCKTDLILNKMYEAVKIVAKALLDRREKLINCSKNTVSLTSFINL